MDNSVDNSTSLENNIEDNKTKGNMAKDTFLYLPAKIIEGIVGIITLSVYTNFFKTEEYGNLNLAITTVSITALVLLGWLFQSAYRYINNFTGEKNIKVFYSTVFIGWTIISIPTVVISLITLFFIKNYFDTYTTYLVLLSIAMFITYSMTQILFYMLSAARVLRLNLILSIMSAIFKLIITVLLFKFSNIGPISAVISIVVVDLAVSIIIISRLKIYQYINISLFSREIMSKFIKYGTPLVGVSLSLSLLNYSDRYIIKLFSGSSSVGIYAANYTIASSVFTMLLFAIMRGVYPNILKTLKQNEKNERNKKEHTEELLSHAVRFFLLITVPAVIGISILSPVISKILDPLYTEGSSVIIWVSIGMFFLGLTEYNNKAWELTSSTGVIFRNSMLCCLFNIISNLILIRFFGYTIAAVNTAIAYFLYFLLSFFGGRKILKWHLSTINYIRIFGSATLMGIVLYIMTKAMPASIWMLIILVPAGMAIYGISLYLTGEIKTEVKQLAAKLRDAKYGT